MPHGTLIVLLEDAVGIKVAPKHGLGDSYCTLQCGSQALSTHIAEGYGSHPTFHTEFKFKIDRSTNDLVINVYGATGEDELVGTTRLDFKTVFYYGHVIPLTAYPLKRPSGKAGGHINVALTFKARPSPYATDPNHAVARQSSAPSAGAVYPPATNKQQQYNYEDGYGSSGSGSSSTSRGRERQHSPYRRTQSEPVPQLYKDNNNAYYDEPGTKSYHHPLQRPTAPPVVVQHAPANAPHRAIPVHRPAPPPPPPVYQAQRQGPVYPPQRPVWQGRGQAPGQVPGPVYNPRGRGRGQQQGPGVVAQVGQGIQAMNNVADMFQMAGNVADLAGGLGDMMGGLGGLGDVMGGLGNVMGGLGGLFE